MDDEPTLPDDASFGEQVLLRMVYSLYRIEGRLDALAVGQQNAVTELEGISISLSRVEGCLGGVSGSVRWVSPSWTALAGMFTLSVG